MKNALMTGAAMAALSLGGCAQTQSAEPAAPMVVGMANPASVYCAKLGGKTRIEKTTAGERGICELPNGLAIEEWALFRRDHPAK